MPPAIFAARASRRDAFAVWALTRGDCTIEVLMFFSSFPFSWAFVYLLIRLSAPQSGHGGAGAAPPPAERHAVCGRRSDRHS
jgi:hypothetical protein